MIHIKHLKGHSGCQVSLVQLEDKYAVLKTGSYKLQDAAALQNRLKNNRFNIPEIYEYYNDGYLMEYIDGDDMYTFIEKASWDDIESLFTFLKSTLQYFKSCTYQHQYNFYNDYNSKINNNTYFSLQQKQVLLDNLPPCLDRSIIHGDLTLDNIIHNDGQFYLIDPNPTEFDNWMFDGCKLRQDLDGYWFLRHKNNTTSHKIVCNYLSDKLKAEFPELANNYVYSFMLSRVHPYCKDKVSLNLIERELERVWQL